MKPPAKSPNKGSKREARPIVMWQCSRDLKFTSTLILQPKQYGPALDTPVAVIPCATLRQARQRVSFERMSWEEKVGYMALVLANHAYSVRVEDYRGQAKAVLLALGHAPEGGEAK